MGYTASPNGLRCMPMILNCEEHSDDGSWCNQCLPGFYFDGHSCIDCEDDKCQKCTQSMTDNTVVSSTCQECFPGYILDIDNSCIPEFEHCTVPLKL